MLQFLRDIVGRIQWLKVGKWPKVRKEIQRLFPGTLALVEKMEKELQGAVTKIGHGAFGVNMIYFITKDDVVSMSGLKAIMEDCARMSLGFACSKEFRKEIVADKLGFSFDDSVSAIEALSKEVIWKREGQECVPLPLITRVPSWFIKDTVSDPWFVYSPGIMPRMLGA